MMENMERFPKHIAIILDGNGRWAASRGLPRALGHKKAVRPWNRLWKTVQG